MRFGAVLLLLPLSLLAARSSAEDDLQTRLYRARDRALPALVNVQPVLDLFEGGRRRQSTATGSGVIVSDDGDVVTNFHVAGHARKIYCTLADKTRVSARLLGADPATDLAILRLDMDEVRRLGAHWGKAKLGSAAPPQAGQFVLALGSPRGLSMSLTSGVISNPERYFGGDVTLPTGEPTGMFNNWIQTDAAINPGNSGGPLVNLDGEVIGINSRAIAGGDGLGFAIPAPVVERVYREILANGRVRRAWLGIDRGLEPLGLESDVRGVRIGHVDDGSPAAKASIRPGDILLEIEGGALDAVHEDDIPPIRRRIADAPLDRPLSLRILRGKEILGLQVQPEESEAKRAEGFDARRFGLTVRALTPPETRQAGLAAGGGVLVTGVVGGGPAAQSGIAAGDILLQIGKEAILDLDSFRRFYRAEIEGAGKDVLLSVKRGPAQMFRALTPSRRDRDAEDDE